MIAAADEIVSAKPRKRLAAKASVRPAADKVKVSIVLSTDVDFKLSVHAAALRIDRSALVNQVLADALKRFVVSDRAKSADPSGEVDRASAA
jgi:hypothetical protein